MIFGVFDMGAGTLLLTDALRMGRGDRAVVRASLRWQAPAPDVATAVGKPLHCRVFNRVGQKHAIRNRRDESCLRPVIVRRPCAALSGEQQQDAGLSCNRCTCRGTDPVAAQSGPNPPVAARSRRLLMGGDSATGTRRSTALPSGHPEIKKAQPIGCAHAFADGRESSANAVPHFTSNCCGIPAALPSTVTSAVYLPAGQPLGLVNSMLVVPASVVLSDAFCSPATWPS